MDQMEQVPLSPERERKTLPDLPAVASSEGDKDRVVVPPPPSEHQTPLTETEEQVQKKNVRWNEVLIDESKSSPLPAKVETVPVEEEEKSNPYVTRTSPPQSVGAKLDRVKSVLRRWGKRVGETAKKTEDLAGNTWQHLRTGPSFADAAMGRIAQTSKVIAEGGYEKIFKSTFETSPDEILKKTFACYLSTSAGPVMGVLYLSTAKLGFCSDNPLSYKNGDNETTAYSYYKVVIPINQLRSVDPSVSEGKPVEKYIQVVSVDNHEFWFLGFVNYDGAIKNIQQLLHHSNIP